jgi:hypothetical protein
MMAGKVSELDKTAIKLKAAREELGKIVFGQESVIDLALITFWLAGMALLWAHPALPKPNWRLHWARFWALPKSAFNSLQI